MLLLDVDKEFAVFVFVDSVPACLPLLLYACLPLNERSFIDTKRTLKLSLGNISCSMDHNWSSSDADDGEVDLFDTLNLRRRQASLFDCMSSNILCRISACESYVPLGFINSQEITRFDEKPPAKNNVPWYIV